MPKVNVRDIEINYHEEGTGFPLVLIHGLSGDQAGWVWVMPEFSKHYRTIAPDVRGHGDSGKPDMPYTIQQFSADLFALFQKLEIRQAHLLGFSMGAAIAQQFVLDHPERVKSLILVSTFSHIDVHLHKAFIKLRKSLDRGGYSTFFDEVVKLAFNPDFVTANTHFMEEVKTMGIKINSPTAIAHATEACMKFNVKNRISQISVPTLIISGREDTFTPLALSEQIHQSIQSSQWKIVEGVGHNIYIEKPSVLAQIVLEFLGRQ